VSDQSTCAGEDVRDAATAPWTGLSGATYTTGRRVRGPREQWRLAHL